MKQESLFIEKGAEFSPCRKYRYALWRIWNWKQDFIAFVGLNPSTADETEDDPTIRRCMDYANNWGYGGIYMLNLFAYRSTDPKVLRQIKDPIGPLNNYYIKFTSSCMIMTIIAWGVHGKYLDRDQEVIKLLRNPQYLKLTKDNIPRHPLYLKKDLKPIPLRQDR